MENVKKLLQERFKEVSKGKKFFYFTEEEISKYEKSVKRYKKDLEDLKDK